MLQTNICTKNQKFITLYKIPNNTKILITERETFQKYKGGSEMNMKKILAILLTIILTCGLIAGCGSDSKETKGNSTEGTTQKDSGKENKEQETTKEPVTIKVAWWSAGEDQILWNQISDLFTEKTGVKVEWMSVTDGYDQKMMTATAGGNPPDVILYWNTPQYVEAGIVDDISDLLERDNFHPEGKYPICEKFEQYKGKTYGISEEITPRAIYYNKKLFDKLGVPYPQDGWTWDEFIETCNALTTGEGEDATYGYIALAGHTYLMQQYIWSNGGDLCSEDGMDAIGYMDSPEVIEAVQWYKNVYDISAQTIQNERNKNLGETEFMSGKVGMMDNGSWPMLSFRKNNELDFGTVTPPVPNKGDKFLPVMHSSAWGISPLSKYREESWEFLKFLNTEEAQKLISQKSIPAMKQVGKDLGLYEDEQYKVFMELSEVDSVQPCFMRNEHWFEADAEFAVALEKILITDADIETELKEAAKRADEILKQ